MQALAEREVNPAQPRATSRARSLIHKDAALEHPKTIGERIAARRKELNLTQAEVAEMVSLTQQSDSRKDTSTKPGWVAKQAGESRPLSRTAYIMYETDSVKPQFPVLEQIALALRAAPEYIAFGVGPSHPIEQMVYNADIDEFERIDIWTLNPQWLAERFDAAPHELALAAINDFSPTLKPGDMAVVRRGVEPNASGGEFVFGMDGELRVAHLTRPARGGPYRVYESDLKAHNDVEPGDLHILGKVIGKIGEL